MPGLGVILGAEFLAATGGDMSFFGTPDRLAGFGGVAPVPRDSGRSAAICGAPSDTTADSSESSIPQRCSASATARSRDGFTIASGPRASVTPKRSSPLPVAESTFCGLFCAMGGAINPCLLSLSQLDKHH
jgi:hypothetical protein